MTATADEILAPDPGRPAGDGDRWYANVTNERALRAAERRHAADLERRYVAAREWADYSVADLRLPWTRRQSNVAAVVLAAAVVVTLIGVIAGSPLVTFGPVVVSLPVSALVVRDMYRRAALWLAHE